MRVNILILIALAIIIGVSCQTTTTKPKVATKAKVGTTATKPKVGTTTSKPKIGTSTTKKTKSSKNPSGGTTKNSKVSESTVKSAILKAGASTPPVFTPPPTPPTYTCNNITGVTGFKFADFSKDRWFLHREMCAFPFNPWFGTCGVGNFSNDGTKGTMIVSTYLEGAYGTSTSSTLTPVGTNGIMNWAINQVSVRTDVMNSTSTLKMVVVGTDYTNWASVHVCGNLCVLVNSTKPATASTACSPGPITAYMIFLRSRTYTKEMEEMYIQNATDALNVKWPYMLFMPDEQSPLVCKN